MAAKHPRATPSPARRTPAAKRFRLAAAVVLAAGAVVSGGLGAAWLQRISRDHLEGSGRGSSPRLQSADPVSARAADPLQAESIGELARPPAQAVEIGRRLFAQEPERADEQGSALLAELLRQAAFAEALELAQASPAELRAGWIATTLTAWVRHEPAMAGEIGAVLVQHGVQGEAWRSVVRSWAESAPSQLAEYARTLEPGGMRTHALETALDRWLQNEPLAAAAWIGSLGATHERDRALTALVTRTDTAVRPRATALAWIAQITDAALRIEATAHVVGEWAATDASQAHLYVEHAGGFTPEQRRQLRTALDPPVREY